jgi:hypothetical protein
MGSDSGGALRTGSGRLLTELGATGFVVAIGSASIMVTASVPGLSLSSAAIANYGSFVLGPSLSSAAIGNCGSSAGSGRSYEYE